MRGKTQIDTDVANMGDIVAVPKLVYTETGDTLCDKSKSRTYVNIDSPAPTLFTAVAPAKKGEEEKMGTGLARLREEDPSFVIRQDTETCLLYTSGGKNLVLK